MEKSVEILAVILFTVIGLSHILQPQVWVEYFILVRGKGEAGAFLDGFIHLPLAGLIVAFHNVWSGIPAVLTVLGWCFLIKSVLRFCLPKPKLGVRMMGRVSMERSWEFQAAGAALVLLAGLIGYGAYGG
jgi:hypothetical protein